MMRRPSRLALLAAAMGAAGLASGFLALGAGATTGQAGAITVSVKPSTGVADGQTVAIHARASGGTVIYQLRAHLCQADSHVRTNFDFGFEGQRCSNAALGQGDVEQTAEYGQGVSAADLDTFKVGAGSVRWVNELGYPQILECGVGHPCDLVVRIQITNDTEFFTAPLCYGASCPVDFAGGPRPVPTPTTAPAAAAVPTKVATGTRAGAGVGSGAAASAGPGESSTAAKRAAAAAPSAVGEAATRGAGKLAASAQHATSINVVPAGSHGSSAYQLFLAALAGALIGGSVVAFYKNGYGHPVNKRARARRRIQQALSA
jgi:hypothetical protein